jgi:hypothetical protein
VARQAGGRSLCRRARGRGDHALEREHHVRPLGGGARLGGDARHRRRRARPHHRALPAARARPRRVSRRARDRDEPELRAGVCLGAARALARGRRPAVHAHRARGAGRRVPRDGARRGAELLEARRRGRLRALWRARPRFACAREARALSPGERSGPGVLRRARGRARPRALPCRLRGRRQGALHERPRSLRRVRLPRLRRRHDEDPARRTAGKRRRSASHGQA